MAFGFVATGLQNTPALISSKYSTREKAKLAAEALRDATDCYYKITVVEFLEDIQYGDTL